MIALLATLCVVAPGDFEPGDFDPASEAWNGLEYLKTTANEARVDVEITGSLDWSRMTRDRVLVLLLPDASVDLDELRAFVIDGGHAVVALDVGASDTVARALGARLLDMAVIHDDYHRDHPGFPRLTPPEEGAHFLWYNVTSLVLNHPAALGRLPEAPRQASLRTVIPFAEPDQAFALEVSMGDGYVLLLSDASVFINDMQQNAYGDKQFTANMLRYFCEDECAATVVLPGAKAGGAYVPAGSGASGLNRVLGLAVDSINETLADAGRVLGTPEALFSLAITLLSALLFGAALLPWPRPHRSPPWQRSPGAIPSGAEYRGRALARARDRGDFTQAVAALRARFVHSRPPPGQEEAWDRCRREFDVLEERATTASGLTASPHPEMRVSAREFEKLWTDCQRVLEAKK